MSGHRFHATRLVLGPGGLDCVSSDSVDLGEVGEGAGTRCTAICGMCDGDGGTERWIGCLGFEWTPCEHCGGTGEVVVRDDCDCAHGCANPGPDCPGKEE